MKDNKTAKIEIDLEYYKEKNLSEIIKYLENVYYINIKKLTVNYNKENYENKKC